MTWLKFILLFLNRHYFKFYQSPIFLVLIIKTSFTIAFLCSRYHSLFSHFSLSLNSIQISSRKQHLSVEGLVYFLYLFVVLSLALDLRLSYAKWSSSDSFIKLFFLFADAGLNQILLVLMMAFKILDEQFSLLWSVFLYLDQLLLKI